MLTKLLRAVLICGLLISHLTSANSNEETSRKADTNGNRGKGTTGQNGGKNDTGGFWNIHLSPNSISSVPFGPGHLTVWEHADAPGRYYAMPLVDLLNKRVKSRYNVFVGKYEMTFDVLMWSVEAKQKIYHHLKEEGRKIENEDNVEMLPMENVRITWKGDSLSPDAPGRLQDNWRSNTDLPPILSFQIMCRAKADCDDLAEAMKKNPSMFNGLHLEYIINGQQASRRKVEITGSMISSGKLFTKLENMPNMTNKNERYISSEDMKEIASETVQNIVATVTRDSNYIDTGDEVSLSDLVQHVLKSNEVRAERFEPKKWDSVFWDPTWTRPDKLNTFLNETLIKFHNDSEHFYTSDRARKSSGNGEAGLEVFGLFKFGGSGGSSRDIKEKVEIKDVQKILNEKDFKVEWTGQVFKVKPMKLYRINLAQLKTSASIAVGSLQIHQYETVQTIPVRVTPGTYVGNGTSSLTADLVQSRLRQELANMSTVLREEMAGKDDDLERLLRTHVSKVATDFRRKDDQLQTTLNAAGRRLAQLPGWPTGNYCIFAGKGRKCPAGFKYYEGHIRAMPNYQCSSNYIKSVAFGSSYIGAHNRCRNQWRADLRLGACCK